jgi:hypothetical protein
MFFIESKVLKSRKCILACMHAQHSGYYRENKLSCHPHPDLSIPVDIMFSL